MKNKKSFLQNPYLRIGIPSLILCIACYLIFVYSSSWTACVFQIISLILGILLVKRGLDQPFLFNPYLFFSICPLSLAVYFPTVSEYYLLEFDTKTYVFALCNMFFFYLGLEFFKKTSFKLGASSIGSKKRWPNEIRTAFIEKCAIFFCFF